MTETVDVQRASGKPVYEDIVHSMLDFFHIPKSEFCVENVYKTPIGPASSITPTTTVIDFFIPGTDDYISLKDTILHLTTTIFNGDLTNLAPDAPNARTGFSQCPLVTLFRGVEIKIGNCVVSDSQLTAHLSAYILLATSFEKEARKSRLATIGW